MHPTKRSRWPIRDILALAVVALCALIILAALIHPGAGFEPLLSLVAVAILELLLGGGLGEGEAVLCKKQRLHRLVSQRGEHRRQEGIGAVGR